MYPDNSAIHKGDSRWFVLLLSPKRLNVFVPPIVDRGTPSVYLTYIVHKDREDKVLEFVSLIIFITLQDRVFRIRVKVEFFLSTT